MHSTRRSTVSAFVLCAIATVASANGRGFDVTVYDVARNGVVDGNECRQAQAREPEPTDPPYTERGAPPSSTAPEPPAGAGVSFEQADRDGSGLIDAGEAKELDLDLTRYDTNVNGFIERTEWERAAEPKREEKR